MTLFKLSSVVLLAAFVMSGAVACGADHKRNPQPQSDEEQQTD